MKKNSLLILGIIWLAGLNAQHSLVGGLLPKITFSEKVSEKIKLVQSIESRQHFFESESETGSRFQYQYVLTDFTSLVSWKIRANQSVNVGYMLRLREGEIFHRLIQQYNFVQYFDFFRMGHRLAADQTFSNESETKYRGRYRITLEKPLSGANVDPGEFYIKLGNEYLWEISGSGSDVEIRILPMMGYEISSKSKVEAGIDYRLSEITSKSSDNALRLGLTWYQSF